MLRVILILVALLATATAHAQSVGGNGGGVGGNTSGGGSITPGANLSTGVVVPTGASVAQTLAVLTAQQGVLLDAFHVPSDPDDTLSMARAVAAGVPIILGPKTYTINNYVMSGTPANFVLRGVPGKSIIQRTSASGSNFFKITATNTIIDGVTFDSNKASVTANQWGVLLSTGGQNVNIRNSVFKNNSGSLGSCFALLSTGPAAGGSFVFRNNEVTGCAANGTFFGSVSNGLIDGNYIHDNAAFGMYVNSFLTASATNYTRDITITNNRFFRNTTQGLEVGGIGPPYVYGTPGAVSVAVIGNQFQDNDTNLAMQGDYLQAIGNFISQSDPVASSYTGIVANSRYSLISGNHVVMYNSSFGIDIGSSVEVTLVDNFVQVNAGAATNIGGSINDVVKRNRIVLSGTGLAAAVYDIDTDASLVPFPQHTTGLDIRDNTIEMAAGGTTGIVLYDNPGGFTGTVPTLIQNNRFVGTNSASATNAISYFAAPGGLQISGNTWNGGTTFFVNPNGSNDLIIPNVYDTASTFAGAGATIRSILNPEVNTYGGGGSVMYATATAGGSGYVKATTTLAASGGCTWTGRALISQGVIYGVRTDTHGTGCSGTTITATDSGGGTGATFTATTSVGVPSGRQILLQSSGVTSILQRSGGFLSLLNSVGNVLTFGSPITLTQVSTTTWQAVQPALPIIAVGSLPACAAAITGATVYVTGSTTNNFLARCNGTVWKWTDGTTVTT